MIGVDMIGRIRRAYFEQHRPIKEIKTLSAGDLGASFGLIDHQAYRAALRRAHGRKFGFWNIVVSARPDR